MVSSRGAGLESASSHVGEVCNLPSSTSVDWPVTTRSKRQVTNLPHTEEAGSKPAPRRLIPRNELIEVEQHPANLHPRRLLAQLHPRDARVQHQALRFLRILRQR